MKSHFITVQNIGVRVKESGSGQPVLFMHGHPDSADMWDGVIERLPTAGFRYIAPELPGYGQSGAATGFDWSLQNRGQYIADILDALGISEPVILVGHDHGGPFVASFAVQFPARVKKLVLQNTLFQSDYEWHLFGRLYRTPLVGEYMALTQGTILALPIAIWYMKKGSPLLTNDYIASLRKTWTRRMGQAMLALYRASDPALFAGWEDRLYELIGQKPVLVLWGDKDFYLPASFAERCGQHGAQVVHFPEAGHWLAVEKPADYAQHLTAFIP